ncbi:MAG: T9SS type A sorting domain-containing protein [bacterium]
MKKLTFLLLFLFFSINAKSEVLFFQAYDFDSKKEILLDSVQLIALDGRNTTIYFNDMLKYYNWQKPNDVAGKLSKSEFLQISNNFPNPFNNQTSFLINSSEIGFLNISIYNTFGQLVFSKTEYFNGFQQEINFELNNLLNGMYVVLFELNGEVQTKKIIKSSSYVDKGSDYIHYVSASKNELKIFTPEKSNYTFIGFASGYENDTLNLDKITESSSYKFNMKKLDGTILVPEFSVKVHLPNSIIYYFSYTEQWHEVFEKFDTTKFENLKILRNAKICENKLTWITTYNAFPEEIGRRYVMFNIDTINNNIKDFILCFNIDSVNGGDIYHIQYTIKLNRISIEQINENEIVVQIKGSDLNENLLLGYHSFLDFVYGDHRTEENTEFRGVLDYYDDSYVEIIIKLE